MSAVDTSSGVQQKHHNHHSLKQTLGGIFNTIFNHKKSNKDQQHLQQQQQQQHDYGHDMDLQSPTIRIDAPSSSSSQFPSLSTSPSSSAAKRLSLKLFGNSIKTNNKQNTSPPKDSNGNYYDSEDLITAPSSSNAVKRMNSMEFKQLQDKTVPMQPRKYKKPDEILGIPQDKPCRRSVRSKESLDLEKMLGPPSGCSQELFDKLVKYELGAQNDSFDEYSNDDFFEDLQFYYTNFTSKSRVSGAFPKVQ